MIGRGGGTCALATVLAILAAIAACAEKNTPVTPPPQREESAPIASSTPEEDEGSTSESLAGAYPISARGGTPATGPGERYNHCERIWCLTHGENFFIDHFLERHVGYVLHEDRRGDIFVTRHRSGGPGFPKARRSSLLLCGKHVHPYLLGKAGGVPIRHTGYNHNLGYNRAHFVAYGTRLDPCCINGLGSSFIHSMAGRQFFFHDVDLYREHPELGWQKPFAARIATAEP